MSFATTALVGNRVLVRGTDFLGVEGTTVLDSSQWVELGKTKQHKAATEEFDAAVTAFYAPIVEAAEKAKATLTQVDDPITYVVLDEAVEGQQAKPAHLVKLTKDSIILRILEMDTGTDMLAWVGDTLEVLAADQTPAVQNTQSPTVAEVTED